MIKLSNVLVPDNFHGAIFVTRGDETSFNVAGGIHGKFPAEHAACQLGALKGYIEAFEERLVEDARQRGGEQYGVKIQQLVNRYRDQHKARKHKELAKHPPTCISLDADEGYGDTGG